MQIKPTFHSKLYREFLALAPKEYHGLIRFYEAKERQLAQLEVMEQYEMLFAYTNALFEVGEYRQFLALVDEAILVVLDDSYAVEAELREETFELLLFRKSAAYLQVLEPAKSEHVCRELLRIAPDHNYALLLLRKALRSQDTTISRRSRPLSILLFGLSAVVILVEVLWVRPFYQAQVDGVELLRNLIFLSGLLVLGGGELLTIWRAYRRSLEVLHED